MRNLIRIEEAAMFGLCLFGLYYLEAEWWYFILLLIGPDISIIGYSAGKNAGALTYNLFHHKAVAIFLLVTGVLMDNYLLQVTGLILFGHSSLDRMFGYGLKLERGFKYTHLGIIGKK